MLDFISEKIKRCIGVEFIEIFLRYGSCGVAKSGKLRIYDYTITRLFRHMLIQAFYFCLTLVGRHCGRRPRVDVEAVFRPP